MSLPSLNKVITYLLTYLLMHLSYPISQWTHANVQTYCLLEPRENTTLFSLTKKRQSYVNHLHCLSE